MCLSAQAPASPLPRDLSTPENGSGTIFLILRNAMDFMICIPADFTRMIRWRNTGHTGAAISGSTAIWMHRKPVYDELLDLVKDKDYFVLTTQRRSLFSEGRI